MKKEAFFFFLHKLSTNDEAKNYVACAQALYNKIAEKTEVNQPVINVYAPLTQENAIGCHAHKTSHNLNLIDGKINNLWFVWSFCFLFSSQTLETCWVFDLDSMKLDSYVCIVHRFVADGDNDVDQLAAMCLQLFIVCEVKCAE